MNTGYWTKPYNGTQSKPQDLHELEVVHERADAGGFVRGLLEPLGGVRVVPVLVVALDGEVKVEAINTIGISISQTPGMLKTFVYTYSSSWMAHVRPSEELTMRSVHTNTLRDEVVI